MIDLKFLGRSQATQRTYKSLLRTFNGDFSFKGAVKFITGLEKYPGNYRRQAYSALQRLFKINNIPWPLDPSYVPYPDENYNRPVLPFESINQLIQFAKMQGTVGERFILAVSTTYGVRRSEIAEIKPEHIKNGILSVQTAKRGMIREHTIPLVIAPYLEIPWRNISPGVINFLFDRLCLKAGITKVNGLGIHAIRRSLVTSLLDKGIDRAIIHKFMGWRRKVDIIEIYDRRSPREVDEQVFAVHPFLTLWEV